MNTNSVIIDVREKDEYLAEHIPNSINLPLSHFSTQAPGVLFHLINSPITIMCRSGKRAQMALDMIQQFAMPYEGQACVFTGGMIQWKKENRPITTINSKAMPIMRQTHLAAGLLALVGTLLGVFLHPTFFILPGIVGAGLSLSGLTGFCGMSILLSKMPWNKINEA